MKEKRLLRAILTETGWLGWPRGNSIKMFQGQEKETVNQNGWKSLLSRSWRSKAGFLEGGSTMSQEPGFFFLLCGPQYQFPFKPGTFYGSKMSQRGAGVEKGKCGQLYGDRRRLD